MSSFNQIASTCLMALALVLSATPVQALEHGRQPVPPSLFGTVAVPTTMVPANWMQRVQGEVENFSRCLSGARACHGNSARWRAFEEQAQGLSGVARLSAVNQFVNASLSYRWDVDATGQEDHWSTASGLLEDGSGDCEDFALAKYWLLSDMGLAQNDMYIMVVQDLVARSPHAYLVIRFEGEFLFLDSRTNNILSPDELSDIVPVLSVSASGAYLHGRRARS